MPQLVTDYRARHPGMFCCATLRSYGVNESFLAVAHGSVFLSNAAVKSVFRV